jgi:voltage-gated potassium channel
VALDQARAVVARALEVEGKERGLERALHLSLFALILANVAAVILESVPEYRAAYAGAFASFERVSVAVFGVEYVLRVWSCVERAGPGGHLRARVRYVLSPMALVDLAAILPSLLGAVGLDLRFARVVRLLRLARGLKAVRYSKALQTFTTVLRHRKGELAATMALGLVLLVVASSGIYYAEHEAQPVAFRSIPASMWWAAVTLTTVGYGDVYPVTTAGRLLGGVVAMLGIGLFALPAGILASGFAEHVQRRAPRVCPHCGGTLDASG